MTNRQIQQLADTYRKRGIVKHGELLLEPKDALELLDELAKMQILVTGFDGWIYVNREKQEAYEGMGLGFSAERFIPYIDLTPGPSIDLIKQYLKEQLPPTVDLVALLIDDPAISRIFTEP